jgi:tetratricopeptide (TPR) repeat protein
MAQATVQTSPSSFKVRKTLAFLLFHSDESNSNLNQVVDQAEKGLAVLDPLPDADNDAESWRFAGNYYFISGDFPRAAERLNRAIAIMEWPGIQPNAEAGYAYRMLALAYLRLNDPQKAANAAERAVQADPFNPERYLQMAEVMARSNHPDQAAITLLQGEALTSDPRVANAAKNADRNRFLCPALANAIAIRMTTGRPDIAQQLKDAATCPAPQH